MTVAPRAAPQPPARRASLLPAAGTTGASTGGPRALAMVSGGQPADLPAYLFAAQRIQSTFTPMLVRRLAGRRARPVVEARDSKVGSLGTVHPAPQGPALSIQRGRVGPRCRSIPG